MHRCSVKMDLQGNWVSRPLIRLISRDDATAATNAIKSHQIFQPWKDWTKCLCSIFYEYRVMSNGKNIKKIFFSYILFFIILIYVKTYLFIRNNLEFLYDWFIKILEICFHSWRKSIQLNQDCHYLLFGEFLNAWFF